MNDNQAESGVKKVEQGSTWKLNSANFKWTLGTKR